MAFNVFDHEVIIASPVTWFIVFEDVRNIAGPVTWFIVFEDGRNIETKRHMVELFPTELWAISFQFIEPVDWNTCRLSHVIETVLEITVEKLSSSLARQAALVDGTLTSPRAYVYKSCLCSERAT